MNAMRTMDEIEARLKEMPPAPPPEMRRFGRFTIEHRMILENQVAVKTIMAGLIVTRAESSYRLDAIEYEAIGDDFREIPVGDDPPTYYPQLFRNEDGSIAITGWKEWIP